MAQTRWALMISFTFAPQYSKFDYNEISGSRGHRACGLRDVESAGRKELPL